MADPEDKRVKLCRYCEGIIEWGTEVCPHCGESLEIVKFDDMEFLDVKNDGGRGLSPPVAQPLPEEPPVVAPLAGGGKPPVARPIGPARKPPVARPLGPGKKKPPVVKPLGPGKKDPPVVKPLGPGKGPPVAKPLPRKGPPVVKPLSEDDEPPIVQPISGQDDPPVVTPIAPGSKRRRLKPLPPEAPAAPPRERGLPPGVRAVEACAVCLTELAGEAETGGTCGSCESVFCYACLLRANGVRPSNSVALNRQRWAEHLGKVPGEKIRCPACGQKGVV